MRIRMLYQGRVQGVGFRATARHVAAGFAVTGWVRNQPDGSVLLEVQGELFVVEDYLIELARVMSRYITSADRAAIDDRPGEHAFVIDR